MRHRHFVGAFPWQKWQGAFIFTSKTRGDRCVTRVCQPFRNGLTMKFHISCFGMCVSEFLQTLNFCKAPFQFFGSRRWDLAVCMVFYDLIVSPCVPLSDFAAHANGSDFFRKPLFRRVKLCWTASPSPGTHAPNWGRGHHRVCIFLLTIECLECFPIQFYPWILLPAAYKAWNIIFSNSDQNDLFATGNSRS